MVLGMFGKKKSPEAEPLFVTVELNARLQPLDRGEFEDEFVPFLEARLNGSVDGGGTQMSESGEVEFCDIELMLPDVSDETIDLLVAELERLGAPKGSRLHLPNDRKQPVGKHEGLAVYLNGVDLPDEVYEQSDVNHVIAECGRLIGSEGRYRSFWQGPTETALYFYGPSFERMKAAMDSFLASYPLCQSCRIVQIA